MKEVIRAAHISDSNSCNLAKRAAVPVRGQLSVQTSAFLAEQKRTQPSAPLTPVGKRHPRERSPRPNVPHAQVQKEMADKKAALRKRLAGGEAKS
jgi:hypothetical protein